MHLNAGKRAISHVSMSAQMYSDTRDPRSTKLAGGSLMQGRHGRGSPDDRDPQAAIDDEATATATVIAGLCRRLQRPEVLRHPKVRNALLILQEQLEEQLGEVDQGAGRHRSAPSGSAGRQINDASEFDHKPDPLTATTPAEFVQVLMRYRYWSGTPSWRTMAANANHVVVHSTMHAAMNSDALPKFGVMRAIIIGCGGGEEDLKAFASAWRRVGGLGALPEYGTSQSPARPPASGDGQAQKDPGGVSSASRPRATR